MRGGQQRGKGAASSTGPGDAADVIMTDAEATGIGGGSASRVTGSDIFPASKPTESINISPLILALGVI